MQIRARANDEGLQAAAIPGTLCRRGQTREKRWVSRSACVSLMCLPAEKTPAEEERREEEEEEKEGGGRKKKKRGGAVSDSGRDEKWPGPLIFRAHRERSLAAVPLRMATTTTTTATTHPVFAQVQPPTTLLHPRALVTQPFPSNKSALSIACRAAPPTRADTHIPI